MSNFERNDYSLTELSLVPTESKKASLFYIKILCPLNSLGFTNFFHETFLLQAGLNLIFFANTKMPICYELFEIMFSISTVHLLGHSADFILYLLFFFFSCSSFLIKKMKAGRSATSVSHMFTSPFH